MRASSSHTKEERPAEKTPAAAFLYALSAALFSLIALFGLFLGYFTENAPLGNALAGGEPIMHGSLLGVLVEVFRGSISFPAGEGSGLRAQLPGFLYLMCFALALCIALSILSTVFAFLRPKAAARLCAASACFTIFPYAILCFGGLLLCSLSAQLFTWKLLDIPTFVTTLASFLLLGVLAAVRRGVRGALNALMLAVTFLGAFAFVFPGTPLIEDFNAAFDSATAGALRPLLLVYSAALFCNFVFSVLRIFAKDSFLPEAVRFGIWFFAALAVFVGYLASGTSLADFFVEQTLPSLFLLLSPLAGLLLAAFGASLTPDKREQKRPLRAKHSQKA